MFGSKKGDIDLDTLGKWMIAIGVLVLVGGGYFLLSGKLDGGLDFLKNLFRFGG